MIVLGIIGALLWFLLLASYVLVTASVTRDIGSEDKD